MHWPSLRLPQHCCNFAIAHRRLFQSVQQLDGLLDVVCSRSRRRCDQATTTSRSYAAMGAGRTWSICQ